ncbi:MAG: hypothetical protein WCF98_11615, partial [Synechococcus sp. ELA057]
GKAEDCKSFTPSSNLGAAFDGPFFGRLEESDPEPRGSISDRPAITLQSLGLRSISYWLAGKRRAASGLSD